MSQLDSKADTQVRWFPHATVATIVEKDGKFLIVEELINGTELVLNQPAGHVENNETFFQAALRETFEETGWKVELRSVLGLYVYRVPERDLTFHRVTFIARALDFDSSLTLDDGIVRALWMTRDEIAAAKERLRSHLVLKCIDDYLSGQQFPLTMIQDSLE
jgi:ADP-ribose pyrophosphatase YjhB (NUDIX family)